MLNDHTASNGALMMTSCLDRNGGRKSCLLMASPVPFLLRYHLHENSSAKQSQLLSDRF
jgi:hypothetical protein